MLCQIHIRTFLWTRQLTQLSLQLFVNVSLTEFTDFVLCPWPSLPKRNHGKLRKFEWLSVLLQTKKSYEVPGNIMNIMLLLR